jgi:hypothetical protein
VTPAQPRPAVGALGTEHPSLASKTSHPVALDKEPPEEPPPANTVEASHVSVSPLPAPRRPVLAMSLPTIDKFEPATGREPEDSGVTKITDSTTPTASPEISRMSGHSATVPVRPVLPQSTGMPSRTPGAADPDLFVQVASMPSKSDAMSEWRRLANLLPDLLGGRIPTITQAAVAGKSYWRLRTYGFASMEQARDLCTGLREGGLWCWYGRGFRVGT